MSARDNIIAVAIGAALGAGGMTAAGGAPEKLRPVVAAPAPADRVGCTDLAVFAGRPCDGPDDDDATCGRWTCPPADNPGPVACVEPDDAAPVTELCDSIDNDCDGITDNGFGVGASCNIGRQRGSVRCAADGTAECAVRVADDGGR